MLLTHAFSRQYLDDMVASGIAALARLDEGLDHAERLACRSSAMPAMPWPTTDVTGLLGKSPRRRLCCTATRTG